MPSSELEGKVALVTGGGRGIGANIARELASAGMDVCGHRAHRRPGRVGRGRDRRARARRRRVEAGRRRAVGRRGGRRRPARLQRRRERPERRLRRAGEWWRTFEVNVLGVYLCCRAVAPGMIERGGGRIVNVAQRVGVSPDAAREHDREHRVSPEQSRGSPLLGGARGRARAEQRVRLLDQPRPRQDGDDGGALRRRCAVDAARVRAACWCTRSRQASSTRSPAATFTRSTIRRTSCGHGSRRSRPTTSTRSGSRSSMKCGHFGPDQVFA